MSLIHEPKWAIFYDVHTMPAFPDMGKGFDADKFTDRIKDCGVDYIVFHARCNLGVAYYNTEVGIRHPSLTYDLFGKLAEACVKKDIAISAYFNVGLSHEEALRHREWTVLTPEGYTYKPDRMNHFFRNMCYNTGYADHLLKMIDEVVRNYPVSGFFLDCIHKAPCICPNCIKEMKKRNLDWQDEKELIKFTSESAIRLSKRISETINNVRDGLLIYFNGITFEEQQDAGSYLEFECLPTGGWGYELLPVYSRYMRNLGKPALNMTGRFHESWGDFGGVRGEASVEYDCIYGLANGMRPTIGDHFHPRGDINNAVFTMIENVYKKLRRYDLWLDGAEPQTEVAVVVPKPGFRSNELKLLSRNVNLLQATARLLCELKIQFDVLTDTIPWGEYKVLILPDYVLLDEDLKKRIVDHLKRGGKILASAWSGLDLQSKEFVLKEWGVSYEGESPYDPAYFIVEPEVEQNMPDMPLTLYDQGIVTKPVNGTDVLAKIVSPYYNRHWDGEHGFCYTPPDKVTEHPAVTQCGNVVHFSHPVFMSYYNHAQVQVKQLIANMLERLLPEPLIKASNLPSYARVMVTAREQQRIVHVLSYLPELRGAKTQIIEEPIEMHDIELQIRLDDKQPKSVYLAPDKTELDFTVDDGYITISIPKVKGYAMVVLEE